LVSLLFSHIFFIELFHAPKFQNKKVGYLAPQEGEEEEETPVVNQPSVTVIS
jgi:hypothetical protein